MSIGARSDSLPPNGVHTRPGLLSYALTIFLGAFLLFQVQPLIGKYILPWFGGGPGVWTTCMLFFQALLLGGYAYAHGLTTCLKPRAQVITHLVLLVAAVALLPIIPGDQWKPQDGQNPARNILILLTVSVGLPYFVLSTTGPLIQQWFSRARPGASPYRLYALSNAGSLLALISYPFVFEPLLTRRTQATWWAVGLGLYALSCAVCALQLWRSPEHGPASQPAEQPGLDRTLTSSPAVLQRFLWIALPACASVLLLGVTNKLCQDVAVIPFLWIVPLSVYLLSFILCFDGRWYWRVPFTLALIAALAGLCFALLKASDWPVWQQVAVYTAGLFICCMVCHGELYRLRPAPARLTSFYLSIAFGGVLGGFFVAVLAPTLFTNYYELHWGMMLCAALFVLICLTEATPLLPDCRRRGDESMADPQLSTLNSQLSTASWRWLGWLLPLIALAGLDWFLSRLAARSTVLPKAYFTCARVGMWAFALFMVISWLVRQRSRPFKHWRLLACLWLSLGLAALGLTLSTLVRQPDPDRVYTSRNFYGMLTVYEHRRDEPDYHHLLLQHGRITHGMQFVDPQQANTPTSYYAEQSGIGLAFNAALPARRRIGVVGLGTGSLAAYARQGDYLRFYEINPEVCRLATSRFKYITSCAGTAEIAFGDARLSMEREPPQHFDLLALDAFSSDSIPVHLLTREAFALYERHLNTNGIIAVHISNHFLDLEPVVANLAHEFKLHMAVIDYDESPDEWWLYSSTWVLLTHDASLLSSPEIAAATAPRPSGPAPLRRTVPLWTDDFASLFQILK